jgi:hypothetical protein
VITVRFDTGFSVQYNGAHYVETTAHPAGGGYHDLLTSKGGNWVARLPITALIEWVTPCRIYDAKHAPAELAKAVLQAIDNREFDGYDLASMKRALRDFNALRKKWK